MTRHYRFDAALLEDGWARDVRIGVAPDGTIATIERAEGSCGPRPGDVGTAPDATQRVHGIAVPGMANAHSHAFQRAMAGAAESRHGDTDSFWTWREAMYRIANRLEPADLEAVAARLFVEMLKCGYTAVAEFHYLHRAGAEADPFWTAVDAAAHATGIALTFLPTLYQHADFGAAPLAPEQARFALGTEQFLRAVERRVEAQRRSARAARDGSAARAAAQVRTGAAFHSLRAVSIATLREATAALAGIDADMPLHIHVSEQLREVEACVRSTGRRPVELLLDTGLLHERWCLVHATHANAAELRGVAASGAAVCLAITTEANLGDGFFESERFMRRGGRVCIGSDSQISVSPAEELRWLEYQQRLRRRRRAVLAAEDEPHVGTRLWREAATNGARALGRDAGALALGRCADLLVLDPRHESLAGAPLAHVLDTLVFAGGAAAIRDVMVGGQWVVRDRRHPAEDEIGARYRAALARLHGP